jgi:hypothetical protein
MILMMLANLAGVAMHLTLIYAYVNLVLEGSAGETVFGSLGMCLIFGQYQFPKFGGVGKNGRGRRATAGSSGGKRGGGGGERRRERGRDRRSRGGGRVTLPGPATDRCDRKYLFLQKKSKKKAKQNCKCCQHRLRKKQQKKKGTAFFLLLFKKCASTTTSR